MLNYSGERSKLYLKNIDASIHYLADGYSRIPHSLATDRNIKDISYYFLI